jgi:hypothetical protein
MDTSCLRLSVRFCSNDCHDPPCYPWTGKRALEKASDFIRHFGV